MCWGNGETGTGGTGRIWRWFGDVGRIDGWSRLFALILGEGNRGGREGGRRWTGNGARYISLRPASVGDVVVFPPPLFVFFSFRLNTVVSTGPLAWDFVAFLRVEGKRNFSLPCR